MKTATTEMQKAKETPNLKKKKKIFFLRQVEGTGRAREKKQKKEKGGKQVCV